MAEQSYASHAHRPVQTSVAGLFTMLALVLLSGALLAGWRTFQLGVFSLTLAVAMLVWMSRSYIVRLQDRIILLEMKVRGAELLTPEQEVQLARLSKGQVIALRFASDAELPDLLERAARENLTPAQIKQSVKNWRADLLRT